MSEPNTPNNSTVDPKIIQEQTQKLRRLIYLTWMHHNIPGSDRAFPGETKEIEKLQKEIDSFRKNDQWITDTQKTLKDELDFINETVDAYSPENQRTKQDTSIHTINEFESWFDIDPKDSLRNEFQIKEYSQVLNLSQSETEYFEPTDESTPPSTPHYSPPSSVHIAVPTSSFQSLRQASRYIKPGMTKIAGQATQTATHAVTGATAKGTKSLIKKGIGQLMSKATAWIGANVVPVVGTAFAAINIAATIGHLIWKQKELIAGMLSTILIFFSNLFALIAAHFVGVAAGFAAGFLATGGNFLAGIAGGFLGYNAQNWLFERLGINPGQNAALAREMVDRTISGSHSVVTDPLTGKPTIARTGGFYDGLSNATSSAASSIGVPLFTTLGIAAFGTFFVSLHIMTAFTVPNPVGTTPVSTVNPPGGGPPLPSTFPPIQCFVFDNSLLPWTAAPRDQVASAINQMRSQFPQYVAKLCASNYQIRLQYGPNTSSLCGYNQGGNVITLHKCGVEGPSLYYLLAHETGHTFAIRYDDIVQDFYFSGFGVRNSNDQLIGPEDYLYSYPFAKSQWEDFAETIGVYIGKPNIMNQYPLHKQFAQTNIFN